MAAQYDPAEHCSLPLMRFTFVISNLELQFLGTVASFVQLSANCELRILNPHIAERKDVIVLGCTVQCTSPTIKRFPKARGTSRLSRAEENP